MRFNSKWVKYIGGAIGGIAAGTILMFGGVKVVYPAISQLVGLAVAQSTTLWNNVIDAAKGDSIGSGILGQSPYLWNGVSFDRVRGDITNGMDVDVTRMSGSITPADAYANPTTANQQWSLNGLFNGATWDRVRSATADALASTGIQTGNPSLFNGATFDRQDGISNTNNIATTSIGAVYSTPLSTWTVINTTAASATAATASKANGGGTVRHVATGLSVCNFDSAVDLVVRLVHLRDGATGAGTILKTWMLSTVVASGSRCENITGLNITGSAATAMTLEFASTPAGATQSQTVSLQGYSTP